MKTPSLRDLALARERFGMMAEPLGVTSRCLLTSVPSPDPSWWSRAFPSRTRATSRASRALTGPSLQP